jgi:rhamnose utilization protein RhaD (predicted bifunctional aldolase and dehydrogenase)/NAD(P)-dependent dehydrogenase (short-subunit alcohol dehydrogenase family)
MSETPAVANRFDRDEAANNSGDLDILVHIARLLGADESLVLPGGGSVSVKVTEPDLFGEPEERLYVSGLTADLASIERADFAPMRLLPTGRLAELSELGDAEMLNAMATYKVIAGAPIPSIEAVLHAAIPGKFVLHTHADAPVTISSTPGGSAFLHEIYGARALIVPYVKPGFHLARRVVDLWRSDVTEPIDMMILSNHGVFTWGETAQEAYDLMIDVVRMAEDFLRSRGAFEWPLVNSDPLVDRVLPQAMLRKHISDAAGAPMLLTYYPSGKGFGLAQHPIGADLATRGPLIPDHIARTKRVPMVGRDVAGYVREYNNYFRERSAGAAENSQTIDPAPRIVIDPELGMLSAGRTMQEAEQAGKVAVHTMTAIMRAEQLERWQPLGAQDVFDVEFGDVASAVSPTFADYKPFSGEVAVVTGAASGIGQACVERLLELGAAVVGFDVDLAVYSEAFVDRPDYVGIHCDVTDADLLRESLRYAVWVFGGIDMIVLNAGVFPPDTPVAEMPLETWRRTMSVNLDANVTLLRESYPLLKLAPRGGRVAVVGSTSVQAPGAGAAAYSASKAALNQLARITALEWGSDGIRVNTVHPNQAFDGVALDDGQRGPVLNGEVTSRDVADAICALLGPSFRKTTGAQIAVDGGNDRVI